MNGVPVIDIAPLLDTAGTAADTGAVGEALDAACRKVGFFSIVGHGVDPALLAELDDRARQFFAGADATKDEIAMERAGRAWRGWFPVGGELTSGVPDRKEGIYFGAELGPDHPRVRTGTPLHGPNLFPHHPRELRHLVLTYIDEMTRVGHGVLAGIAIGLGLERTWFADHLAADPLILFRIFHYPPTVANGDERWGVAEHTDYGLLTILGQDHTGGLQVRTPGGWLDADPRPGAFVCNIGDMLERLTGGRYRSTPHRVRSPREAGRLSFAFFLDPSWDAVVDRLPIVQRPHDDDGARRWDHTSVHGFAGTYGEYILAKVAKVFPDLAAGSGTGR
jgi:isopenicillin N synthase-like dioxygenase